MKQSILPFLPTASSHQSYITDDCPALIDDTQETWLTYGELRSKIKTVASKLTLPERGIVLCCIPRSIEGVVAYLAAVHAGHSIILVSPDTSDLSELIESYQPNIIITNQQNPAHDYTNESWELSDLSLYKTDGTYPPINEDMFLLLLTSGSTGSSKGVRLSYKNIASNTSAIIKSIELTSSSTALGHLPLSYSFGLSVLHTHLAVGGRIILSEKSIMSGDLWKLAAAHEATLFAGVPYQYEMLMRLGLERIKVPTMHCFLQAGGKMPLPMTNRVFDEIKKASNGELHIMYGQTEAAPRMTSFPLHNHPEKIGSAGKALEGSFITIEHDELVYHGPNVMMGYATMRDDFINDNEMGGVLRTGDLATMDEDGYVTITGRAGRFAKLYGQRIALDDLEKIASHHGFAVAAEGKEKAIIFTRSKNEEDHHAIKSDITEQTKIPPTWIEVRVVDEIPHKPNGKIDYKKINALVE